MVHDPTEHSAESQGFLPGYDETKTRLFDNFHVVKLS